MSNCCIHVVVQMGFSRSLYSVQEGEQTSVSVCVEVFDGPSQLTDIVAMEYMVSTHSQTASGMVHAIL